MTKPAVHFDATRESLPARIGWRAVVWPIDHTSPLVSNTKHVLTSTVVKLHADGSFETENSLYVPTTGGA